MRGFYAKFCVLGFFGCYVFSCFTQLECGNHTYYNNVKITYNLQKQLLIVKSTSECKSSVCVCTCVRARVRVHVCISVCVCTMSLS